MADKRSKMLTMWVTEDEHRRLLERCDGKQLAAWMRQTCLDEKPARAGKLPSISPALLRQLAGMGNNLNQIARQVDGAGKTVAERIRAATAGLLEKAGRVGERLRGMADDVWAYATGERGAERARHGLEQAGAEFERAASPVVERLNAVELHQQQERAAQHQKTLELERSQRQRTYNGPSL